MCMWGMGEVDKSAAYKLSRMKKNQLVEFKCALSSLRQFFVTESPLKNAFYFTSKDLFVLKIFKFLS